MKTMSKKILFAAAIALCPLLLPTSSLAQEAVLAEPDGERTYELIPEAFEDAFFSNDPTFFRNRGIGRQLTWMFGSGIENEIWRDGRNVHERYVELLEEQVSTTSRIRTPDLVNPYETSLILTPISEIGIREFEDQGFRQPIPAPPAPPAPAPTPVPALW
jgi:hypothetical protein